MHLSRLSVLVLAFGLCGCLKPGKETRVEPNRLRLEDTLELLELRSSEKAVEVGIARTEVARPGRAADEAIAKDFAERLHWTKNEFGDLTFSAGASTIWLDFFQPACADPSCESMALVLGRDGTGKDASEQAVVRLKMVKSLACTLTTTVGAAKSVTEMSFPTATLSQPVESKHVAVYARGTRFDDASSTVLETYLRTTLQASSRLIVHVLRPITRPRPGEPAKVAQGTEAAVRKTTWDESKKLFDVDAEGPDGAKHALRCKY